MNLALQDVDERRATVWLHEKFGFVREQPVSPSLCTQLVAHAQARGATDGTDKLFRTSLHRPIGQRRYDVLFGKVQAVLPWSVRTPVTAHVLRWTAATAIERLAGEAVSERFLGHKQRTYTNASLGELAAAIASLTAEAHPLARTRDVKLLNAGLGSPVISAFASVRPTYDRRRSRRIAAGTREAKR